MWYAGARIEGRVKTLTCPDPVPTGSGSLIGAGAAHRLKSVPQGRLKIKRNVDAWFRAGRLRSRTNGVGVLGVGALDTEATRRPNVHASCIRAPAGGI